MSEKLLRASVSEAVKSAVESVKVVDKEVVAPKIKTPSNKETYKGIVEAALRGIATKVVLSHSFADLGDTLQETLLLAKKGGLNVGVVDQLKGRVLDTVVKIKGGEEGERISRFINDHFKHGKYEDAASFLKSLVMDDTTGLNDKEKAKLSGVLDKIKAENAIREDELKEVAEKGIEIRTENNDVVKIMINRSDEIELELNKAEIELLRKNQIDPTEPTRRTINEQIRDKVNSELQAVKGKIDQTDLKFIQEIVVGRTGDGDKQIDFSTMDRKLVYHVWYRTSGIMSKGDWSTTPESLRLLNEVNRSARARLLEFAQEGMDLKAISPSEAKWLGLPKEERELITENLEFLGSTKGDFRELLRLQEAMAGKEYDKRGLEREHTTRTDVAMATLIAEYAEKNPEFHLERKLIQIGSGKWKWVGEQGQSPQQQREEFFDVCRGEVYGIQGQLSQENMSNLVFEESAQKYLALMRLDVGDDLELESVKDAITKTLYIEFAVKTMWRSGGNIEAWQRAAGMLTQDSERNFFQLMNIGEMLKVKSADGEEIEIGRFNWEDLMNLAEMKAENGQYYLTYMAGQSEALRKERKPEFAAAMADLIIKKKILKGELTQSQAKALMVKVQSSGAEFTNRQVRSMVDYMQFLEVATFRAGEFGLNQSMVEGKFEYTDLPCGEAAQKTGPWSIVYDWYYPVTKYGGEWVGKIFLPNVNVLSYARSETLGHFIAEDSKVVAGMRDKNGEYIDSGVGAKEFFFKGTGDSKGWTEFWGDVIFDIRTGGISEAQQKASIKNKNSINKSVELARKSGHDKFELWKRQGKLSFVENVDYSKMEVLLGYTIPGSTKLEKFEWMTENFDYSFWRKDLLKSKRVGDWVNKYVPKKYEEARLKLADLLNSPGTATLGALRDVVSEYSDESGVNEMGQWLINENRNFTAGFRTVDKNGHEEGSPWYDPSSGRRKLVGAKSADRSKSKWTTEGAGDFFEVSQQWHSPFEGFHWGSKPAWSRQEYKELFRDPMYFEEMEIDNQFHAGMMSREEWGKAKRDWQKKMYFGDFIPGTKLRWGFIPLLTPISLFRGWWVDRMSLDWEDFMIVFHKNNKESWEQIKKAVGFKF